jgi:hypothetical protein
VRPTLILYSILSIDKVYTFLLASRSYFLFDFTTNKQRYKQTPLSLYILTLRRKAAQSEEGEILVNLFWSNLVQDRSFLSVSFCAVIRHFVLVV